VERVDVLIDDGGYTLEQQRTTLEEMLPHLQPSGIYICEDMHGRFSHFAWFVAGLVHELNQLRILPVNEFASSVSPFQAAIHSIHFYPYLVAIEK
jgi:hypothetical protein